MATIVPNCIAHIVLNQMKIIMIKIILFILGVEICPQCHDMSLLRKWRGKACHNWGCEYGKYKTNE